MFPWYKEKGKEMEKMLESKHKVSESPSGLKSKIGKRKRRLKLKKVRTDGHRLAEIKVLNKEE